jgi:DNA-binding transcriptional LysR family regulator
MLAKLHSSERFPSWNCHMSPSLKEIRMFVSVYEEESFTAAALRECTTQSGVSQHIRNLEANLGVQLFSRTKGVQPTPAGVAYYRRCLEVLRAHALARRTLDEFAPGLSGNVAAGLPPTLTRSVLAPAFQRLAELHPNINVRIVEAGTPLLANALRGNTLDFAILPRVPSLLRGMNATLFVSTPEYLVGASGRGMIDGEPVRLADIPNLKLMVPSTSNPRRHALEEYFALNSVRIEARQEFDTMTGTLAVVSKSEWKVIFPGLLIGDEMGKGRFCIHPLKDPLSLDLYLVEPERQPLSAAATAFVEQLRLVAAELNMAPSMFKNEDV